MSGLIDIKALNLSLQGKKKKENSIPAICHSEKGKTMETIKRSMAARSLRGEGR